jgi:hypothetical protein
MVLRSCCRCSRIWSICCCVNVTLLLLVLLVFVPDVPVVEPVELLLVPVVEPVDALVPVVEPLLDPLA